MGVFYKMLLKSKDKLKEYYPIIIILCVSTIFVSPQIFNKSVIFGADVPFHFNRFYDIYMQIKNHNISIFQTNYGFNQTGRIINALYGPGFAVFLGLILTVVHSWLKFQVITSFIIFVVSGYSMYKLAVKLGANKFFSTISAVLFMSSYAIQSWVTVESFMSWGAMLMPLVIMVGIDMVSYDESNLSVVKLALVIALVIQVHILSALFSVMTVSVFFIIGMIRNKKRLELLYKAISAGLICMLLTFNVWGAMLEIFSSNTILTPFPVKNMSGETTNLSVGNSSIYEIGIVLSIAFLFQIVYVIRNSKKLTVENRTVTALGGMFVILASNMIPWTILSRKIPSLQNMLQFPYRFLTMGSALLIAGLAVTLTSLMKEDLKNYELISNLIIFGTILLSFQTLLGIQHSAEIWNTNWPISTGTKVIKVKKFKAKEFRNSMTDKDLNGALTMVTKSYPDYLPTNVKKNAFDKIQPYTKYAKQVIFNQKGFSRHVKNDKLIINWNSKHLKKGLVIPVTIYRNSIVKINDHVISHDKLKLTQIGTLIVDSKKGKNSASVVYHSKFLNKFTLMLVVIIWLICISLIFLGI